MKLNATTGTLALALALAGCNTPSNPSDTSWVRLYPQNMSAGTLGEGAPARVQGAVLTPAGDLLLTDRALTSDEMTRLAADRCRATGGILMGIEALPGQPNASRVHCRN